MSLERKKKELEIAKVECAKQEMEYKILERMEEIKRLEENILIQEGRIEQLKMELEGE
jgi:coenzyme F420-reducing hydrogenase delta subunit